MKKNLACKALATMLAAFLLVSASACSGTPKAPSQAGNTGDSYKPDSSKTYDITIINRTNWPVDNNGDLLKRWDDKFNIRINVINLDAANATEQLNLKIAGGETPDVFNVDTVSLYNYQKQGALAKIPDPVLKQYLPKCTAELEKESPGITSFGYIDNARYGIPNSVFYYNNYISPIVYNGLWMKKVGITSVPSTLSDLETLLTKFANSDPDGDGKKDTYGLSNTAMSLVFGAYGVSCPYGGANNMTGFSSSNCGGQWVIRDGKVVYDAILPEAKQALQTLNKWYKAGILDPQFITGENTGGYWAITQPFINQEIGLTCMGAFYHWSPETRGRAEGQNLTELKKANTNLADNIVFGKPITWPNGKGGIAALNTVTGYYLVFGKQLEKDPGKMGKILQMIDYLNGTCTEDTYLSAFYGIKGKDWTMNSDGSLKMITKNDALIKRGAFGTMQFITLGQNNSYPEAALKDWAKGKGLLKSDNPVFESVLSPLAYIPSMYAVYK